MNCGVSFRRVSAGSQSSLDSIVRDLRLANTFDRQKNAARATGEGLCLPEQVRGSKRAIQNDGNLVVMKFGSPLQHFVINAAAGLLGVSARDGLRGVFRRHVLLPNDVGAKEL